jgi:hypothetical protein
LPLLAAPAALLLIQGQAKALLTYNIFESGSNVVVETSGSLDLTGAIFNSDQFCVDGAIQSIFALLCTGTSVFTPTYNIMGPTLFDGTVNIFPASNVSGTSTILVGEPSFGVLVFLVLILPILPTLQLSAAPHSMVKPWQASASPQQV